MVGVFDRSGLGGDFEQVHAVQDAASGLRAFVAVHSTRRGPAFGGIRRRPYPSEEAALADALALAATMTAKLAAADMPAGGAKTVVLDGPGVRVADAYEALGRHVEAMGGRYVCGPDVGTGERELDRVRAATRWVNPKGNDANAATARGVVAGIRAVVAALNGPAELSERSFVVQGLGGVGLEVAAQLRAAGARVAGADVDAGACARARDAGVALVAPDEVLRTPCDVFVPCALGGVVSEAVARALPARGVCGSANNQLASPRAGEILFERGVVYAPDFVVNAGAVVEGVFTVLEGATGPVRAKAARHIDATQDRLGTILEASRRMREPPERVAWSKARVDVA